MMRVGVWLSLVMVVGVVCSWCREKRQSERCVRCTGALEGTEGGLPCLCMYDKTYNVLQNSIVCELVYEFTLTLLSESAGVCPFCKGLESDAQNYYRCE